MLTFLRRLLPWWKPPAAGAAAESCAASWLQTHRGFQILARNWRSPRDRRDEIDLICREGPVLVFVEVKARSAGALVPGFYAVNARKKRVLRRAAIAYLAQLRARPATFRFDVVEVGLPAGGDDAPMTVLHFENIPLFGKHLF